MKQPPKFTKNRPSQRDSDRNRPPKSAGRDNRDARPGPAPSGKLKIGLYGIHAVAEAIINPARTIRAIYATEQAVRHLEDPLNNARAAGLVRPGITEVEREVLDRALPREAVHQGIALDCAQLPETTVHDLIVRTASKDRALIVMLDQVTDPHNIGAVLRSACVFGADGLIVQNRNAPDLNALIAKTACGGMEHVPVAAETNLARTLDLLKKEGFFVVGLDERGAQTPNQAPDFAKCVLVMGAEGPGLRPLVRDHCDLLVRLPVRGPISSLNVSNAAAVALYAMTAK